jgi:regulator of protease activity HflC (stomatin/prohibitin superfamily)
MFASNAGDTKSTYNPPTGTQVEELGSRSPKNTTTASDKKKFSLGWSDRDMSPRGVTLRKRCLWAFAFCVLITGIAVLAASLKKVESTEYGLQYNIHKKELDDASKSGGLFAGPPGYEFIKVPSTFITVDLDDRTCVSNDGLLVDFSVSFQYQMTEANLLPAVLKYRDFHKWADTVEEAGLSAIHHSCSEFQVTEFQSKRGIIQTKMEENLRLKLEGDEERGLDGVNAVAVSVQLRYIGLPPQYNDAVQEKQAAEEDIALAVAQRKQETTKANTDLLRAKEEARKIMDTAVNEAEVLLTESQLKAEETLFSFEKEADALVQVKEALGLTSEGVLAYLSNMLLSEVSNLVVTTGEPAQLSRKDLL